MVQTSVTLVTEASFAEDVLQCMQPVLVAVDPERPTGTESDVALLDTLARDNAGKIKICVVVETDAIQIAETHGIRRLPAWMLFRGGEMMDKVVGKAPRQIVQHMINKHGQD